MVARTRPDFSDIVAEINARASGAMLGRLRDARMRVLRKKRLPCKIFTPQTISLDEAYAFHHGGRTELQFNVGLEEYKGITHARFGVAFSFQPSQTMSDISMLMPKVQLFNEYLENRPQGEFRGMHMWHWHYRDRNNPRRPGETRPPESIPPELVSEGVFVFLGIRQPINAIDYDKAMEVMNRLFPLYLYTLCLSRE